MSKALILDRRAAVLAIQVCRSLAKRGHIVDIFGEPGSPAFHSRFCTVVSYHHGGTEKIAWSRHSEI